MARSQGSRETYALPPFRLWLASDRAFTGGQLADELARSIWTACRICLGFYVAGLVERVDERRRREAFRLTARAKELVDG
jgi:hypothetical protein